MKLNRGKRKLALRIACFLISILMMCGLYQPGSRVYAKDWDELYTRCLGCGSSDTSATSEITTTLTPGDSAYHIIYTHVDIRCNACGEYWGSDDVDFEYHTYVDPSIWWAFDEEHWIPSYTENGVTYYICDKCGHVETRQADMPEEIHQEDVHSHTWDQGTVTTSATYTSDGVMTYTCTGCGATRTESIPKLVCASHTWDNGKVTTEATYKTGGVKTYTCTNCGATRTESIPMLVCTSHTWDNGKVTTEATYKTEGVKTYTCTNCGATRTESIPKLVCASHNWDNGKVTTEATYKTGGVKTYTCTNCGATRTEAIPMLVCTSHNWDNGKVTTEATYKTGGVKTYTCTNCGETRTEKIPKLVCASHSWDNGKVTTEATYKTGGVKTYTCTNCGETRTEAIPMLVCTTHVYGDALLTPTGSGEFYYISECTRCGEKHSVLHEHNYKWVTVKPATEEETGTERYICEECGYYKLEREIPKIQAQVCTHPYPREFVETVPATCCRGPIGNVVCKECGEIIVYDYESSSRGYNPDNHSHFTATVRVEPTYKSNGVMRYTCDGCGYYYTESIPKLECPHAHTNVKDLADGSWKVCKDCGEKLYRVSSIPSTCSHVGTKKTQVLVKAATPTEWGEAAIVCECGKTVSTEKIHPYSEYQVTKPDGSVVTVYGWFDYDAAHEIADLTNSYRIENGLNALTYNESLQSGSDTRALETIVSFSHTRPNGTRWNTTLPQWQYGGENLASGQTTVQSAMNAWKDSESHNDNLLYGIKSGQTPFKGISVGVFHRVLFPYETKPYTPYEYTYYTQQFTFY